MSNRQRGIRRFSLMHCSQAEHHGVELKHAVWVWKVCMFWYHCVALCVSVCGLCVCVRERQTTNQLSPVWSTAARVKLFSAFLHRLPPPAGSDGSSAARSSTPALRSASSGTAAPTVASGKSRLFCFPLKRDPTSIHTYTTVLHRCKVR